MQVLRPYTITPTVSGLVLLPPLCMAAGILDVHVKMLGRWKRNAYQLYVKTPPSELASFSKTIVLLTIYVHLFVCMDLYKCLPAFGALIHMSHA